MINSASDGDDLKQKGYRGGGKVVFPDGTRAVRDNGRK